MLQIIAEMGLTFQIDFFIVYFIMNNGLIIPTRVLAEKYKEVKGLKESTRIESVGLLELLTKHLNLIFKE